MPQLSIRETASSQEFVSSLDAGIRRLVYRHISLGIDLTAMLMIIPHRKTNVPERLSQVLHDGARVPT